jgi:AcrR family transcriptional regulator
LSNQAIENPQRKQSPPRKRMTAQARREVIELAATEVFAERGYHGASMDEIARRSGVSPPVVYDHFKSKQDLHTRLLERHLAELRLVWREHLSGEDPQETRIAQAFDAWFGYVQTHPYAWKMLFRDTTGEPEVEAVHRQIRAQSRAALLPLLAHELGRGRPANPAEPVDPSLDTDRLEMVWELLRSGLQGLALWWYEHQHIPRAQIVETAMNGVWLGLERVRSGETWQS